MSTKPAKKTYIIVPDAKRVGKDKFEYTPEELYNEYYKFFLRRFTAMTGSPEDGEDLTHNVFEKVVRHWHSMTKYLNRIEAALSILARNEWVDYLAYKNGRGSHEVQVEDILEFDNHDGGMADPYRIILNDRGLQQISETTQLFSESQEKVFNMYFINGMDVGDIAEETSINTSTVYSILYAIKKLVNEHCYKPVNVEELTWMHNT